MVASDQLHALAAFIGKNPGTRQIGGWMGPHSWHGHFGEEISPALAGIQTPHCPTILVTVMTKPS